MRITRGAWAGIGMGGAVAAGALALLLGHAVQAADPDALWKIVHGKCVPDEQAHGTPAPCAEVVLQGGVDAGYALLKDLVGPAQFLLIPTARVTGIEAPVLLQPGAPNYFAPAWQAQSYVDARLGRTLSREDVSLAINSIDGRTQDQLHIHVDCIRADVRDALQQEADTIGPTWAPLPQPLAGHGYLAMRVSGADLTVDPFRLVADGIAGARQDMGLQTIFVTGTDAGGAPGFILLEDHADLARGNHASAEELQDHDCHIAGR